MIDGILPVDKPAAWTSHDVVARVRRVAGQRQVGHAGTLDPLATGVLVLVLGKATRLSAYLMESPKTYCAEIVLGATTVTDDAEAPLLHRRDVSTVGLDAIQRVLTTFQGSILQTPPVYAAVRHHGKKLYQLARQGKVVEVAPREVMVYHLELLCWQAPRLRLRIVCGAGTYIRSLARDIGVALEVGGYLHALRRTSSGHCSVDTCIQLDRIVDRDAILRHLLPPDAAVLNYPAVVLAEEEEALVRQGSAFLIVARDESLVRMYSLSGTLVALGNVKHGTARPFRVFN